MKSLVGFTGFVGSNIASQTQFDGLYNSKNIGHAFDTSPELLVYAGVRAEKYLANKDPDGDLQNMHLAFHHIRRIKPKYVVLISTIDVFVNSDGADEDSPAVTDGLTPYGKNRFLLETMVEASGIPHSVIRLPGLFGEGIKKNFIYDLIHIIPHTLTEQKFLELCQAGLGIAQYYENTMPGFYNCKALTETEKTALKEIFIKGGFTALHFTDSRGVFQFYNLNYIWEHIQRAVYTNLKRLHLAVEPVSISEIYKTVKNQEFYNEIAKEPPLYNFRTKHAAAFGGSHGYLFSKDKVLEDISRFICRHKLAMESRRMDV